MLEPLARLGYASKAIIYGIVGLLAILTAANRGGRITDTSGALRVVIGQPFGQFAIVVLAIGLCGYATWRLLDAAMDPDRDGTDAKGLVVRIGNAIRGCIYGALGIEAFRLLRGLGGSKGDEAEVWTARILDLPLGGVLIGLVGAVVAVYGLTELVGSIRAREDKKVDYVRHRAKLRAPPGSSAGSASASAAASSFTLGAFLVRAALHRDPNEAAGAGNRCCGWAVWWTADGSSCSSPPACSHYAVDQAVHARCRRIRPVL